MKSCLVATALLCCAIALGRCARAETLEFKGNHLGMSLAEFKQKNNAGPVIVNTCPSTRWGKVDHKCDRAVPGPLCTSELTGFPGSEQQLGAGVVLCNASPYPYEEGRVVAGELMDSVYYRFYGEKLYLIDVRFSHDFFDKVLAGFKAKYGDPTGFDKTDYANLYGAKWSGNVIGWASEPSRFAVLVEGAGGLAGASRRSGALFIDAASSPPAPKPAIDF